MTVHDSGSRQFRVPGYVPTADRFVRRLADEWGDRHAVVLGERRLSYMDAEAESRRLGRALQASGVGRGSRVALLAPNGPEWVVAWLAAARVGALVVLLNTFHQARELGWALAHCGAEVLLTADRYLNHDYASRLEAAVPGLAAQTHEAIAVDGHPSLRTVWMWHETAAQRPRTGSVTEPSQRPRTGSVTEPSQRPRTGSVTEPSQRPRTGSVTEPSQRPRTGSVTEPSQRPRTGSVTEPSQRPRTGSVTEPSQRPRTGSVTEPSQRPRTGSVTEPSQRPWAGSVTGLLDRAGTVSGERFEAAAAAVDPRDPMVVIYTSGSTSEPKGVVHSHSTVIVHPFNLLQFRDLLASDVLYTPMPLFWVGGLSYTLVSAMHVGATVVFEERFEPGATLELIERRRVTHVIGWPHTAKALVEHPSFAERDLSSIRGGSFDALLPEHLRVSDPRRRATSLGMTESLGPHTIEPLSVELPEGREDSFGRSVPGIEHRIVDPATGADLPTGEAGEIWIRGYSLMLGLLGRDPADVFEPGGWYRTGDSGRFDADGHLYFQGRMGAVIKAAGTNVAPREVELAIEEQPGVMHAFVVGVPSDDGWGEAVAAAVVARPGAALDADGLRASLRAELASYKVPRHVAVFAEQGDLPWLESGKIDLQALRRMLTDRFSP